MKPISKYQGLVLKTKDYKETSSLVTIITKDFKQNYIVKGTKKINSKTSKWINFLNNISFNATDTTSLNTLTEAYVINSYPNIILDQTKLEVAFVITEKLELLFEQVTDTNKLYDFTLKILELTPKQVDLKEEGLDSIKKILGNLKSIPNNLSNLRNTYGSGHGKSKNFKSLDQRHAKLAVGASLTFVGFVWETYNKSKT